MELKAQHHVLVVQPGLIRIHSMELKDMIPPQADPATVIGIHSMELKEEPLPGVSIR